MRNSTRFSDGIHILAFIKIYDGKFPLTSERIAESVQTSPVVIRRLMSSLRKAGLLTTTHGTADPRLSRPASDITLFDIYLATEGAQKHLFSIDDQTDPQCIVGGNIQSTLAGFYRQAETAAEAKLIAVNLQDVIDGILVSQAKKASRK